MIKSKSYSQEKAILQVTNTFTKGWEANFGLNRMTLCKNLDLQEVTRSTRNGKCVCKLKRFSFIPLSLFERLYTKKKKNKPLYYVVYLYM